MDQQKFKQYEGLSTFLALAPLSSIYAIASQRQPALVFGALLTSFSVFEGFLNYLGRTLRNRIDGEHSTNQDALDLYGLGRALGTLEEKRASYRCKVDEIFLATRGTRAPWGELRYQQLNALYEIRNLLTHPKVVTTLRPPVEAGVDQSDSELESYAAASWKKNKTWKSLVEWEILSNPLGITQCGNFSDALICEPSIAVWGHNIVADIVSEIHQSVRFKEAGGKEMGFALIAQLVRVLGVVTNEDIAGARSDILVPPWMRSSEYLGPE